MDKNIQIFPKEQWPKKLLEIPQPPKQLFIEGKIPSEDYLWLCVVGSRKNSLYGKEICQDLIRSLQGQPIVIVSGLALGIDSIAHQTAIEAGLPTIALPGSGLSEKVIHPRSNINLARNIIKNKGALISEFESNFKATMWAFPRRNRLMVGLCDAVLIIEARKKSGTLITARMATDYNRDVYTVPGSIYSKSTEGPHSLIKQGATPITSPEDLLEELGMNSFSNPDIISKFKNLRQTTLSEEEKDIFKIIKEEPLTKEQVLLKSNYSIEKINQIITSLELKDLIKESVGIIRLA